MTWWDRERENAWMSHAHTHTHSLCTAMAEDLNKRIDVVDTRGEVSSFGHHTPLADSSYQRQVGGEWRAPVQHRLRGISGLSMFLISKSWTAPIAGTVLWKSLAPFQTAVYLETRNRPVPNCLTFKHMQSENKTKPTKQRWRHASKSRTEQKRLYKVMFSSWELTASPILFLYSSLEKDQNRHLYIASISK